MSVIAQYLVSVANPSTVSNVGAAVASKPATGGYFSSPPPSNLREHWSNRREHRY